MFQQIFDTRVRNLWNLYEATGELNHRGEKGLLREIFLRRILESVLPTHFAVGSGIVVDKWNRQSPQADLVIYDRRRFPPIFEEHGHGIYPMDAVLRVIEVKSSLDKAGLAQLKQLAQMLNPGNPDGLKIAAKGTLENGHAYYPFSSLFAYKTTLKDISKTMKLIGGFDGLTVPICVAKQSTDDPSSDSLENKLRRFLTFLLNEIEISADSRKPFSVVEWLSNDR